LGVEGATNSTSRAEVWRNEKRRPRNPGVKGGGVSERGREEGVNSAQGYNKKKQKKGKNRLETNTTDRKCTYKKKAGSIKRTKENRGGRSGGGLAQNGRGTLARYGTGERGGGAGTDRSMKNREDYAPKEKEKLRVARALTGNEGKEGGTARNLQAVEEGNREARRPRPRGGGYGEQNQREKNEEENNTGLHLKILKKGRKKLST